MRHRCSDARRLAPISCASLSLLATLVLEGCGQQNPAFRETMVDAPKSSSDAQTGVQQRASADSMREAGEGPIDPAAMEAAIESVRDRSAESGTPGREQMGSGGDRGGNPKDQGMGHGAGNSGGQHAGDPGSSNPANPSTPASPANPGGEPRDNHAKDSANPNEGGFGSEGSLPLNWRTVQLTQGGPGKVDILWIVDTSGSMAEEQAYLSTNFSAFIGSLRTAGQDFQTAITTTDICDDEIPDNLALRACPVAYGGSAATRLRGLFVGDQGRKVLKQGDADLVERFTNYTRLGVNGSGFEHGLKAAEMAIAKSLSGVNESLVRRDAFLAVVVVSDEEDDGIGLSMLDAYHGLNFFSEGLTTFRYTDDDFINFLTSAKGVGNFSVSTIAPTRLPDGTLCSAPHTQPLEEGTQYISAAKKSGGIVQSICDTNWNQALAKLGADLSAQISQVVLPSKPDPATLKVKVDQVPSSAWTYVPANNAIKFNVGSIPQKGANIVIGYVER